MQIRELKIPDSYEFAPTQHADDRGTFLEWYRHDLLEQEIGHSLNLRQANTSISRKGVVRGIHFASIPPGQAKYVTVAHGAILDFVVDIRVGSPTFGEWDSVLLDSVDRKALYIAEGLGHAFIALSDDATVSYLVSDTYHKEREHGINPLDAEIGLVFPDDSGPVLLSPKDADAPSLREAADRGLLPGWKSSRSLYESLATGEKQ